MSTEQDQIFKCDWCSDTEPHVHTNFTAMWRQQAEFVKQQSTKERYEPQPQTDKWPAADIHLL